MSTSVSILGFIVFRGQSGIPGLKSEGSRSGDPRLDQRKQADAMSDLIPERSKHAFLFRVIHYQGIIEMPLYAFPLRKTGAFRPRTIAQRNHEAEAKTQNVMRGFCRPPSQINTNLLHHLDRKRMDLSAIDAGAHDAIGLWIPLVAHKNKSLCFTLGLHWKGK